MTTGDFPGNSTNRQNLEHFHNSDPDVETSVDCGDVYISVANKDDGCEAKPEVVIVAEAVSSLPGFGEVKVGKTLFDTCTCTHY